MTNSAILSQSVYASVAHRYWNSQWSEAENARVYGRDASLEGLGNNLRLELAGGSEMGLRVGLNALKAKVDHQCLFADGAEFSARPSTLENITAWLSQSLAGDWQSLTVWESERLGCHISRGQTEVVLIFKRANLTLKIAAVVDAQSGIAVERARVDRAVSECLVKLKENNDSQPAPWSRKLFLDLKISLPSLFSLMIDLGRHEALVVHS